MIKDQNVLAIVGGYTGAGTLNKMLIVGSGRVVVRHDALGTSAVLAAGGVIGKRILVVGGTDDPSNLAGLRAQALALDLPSGTIENLPDYPGKPFGIAASAVADGQLFIFGGANWAGTNQDVVNTSEAYALSMPAKVWRKLRPFPYAVRGLTAVALDDRRLYLAGGFKNDAEGFTDEGFVYDIANDTYTPAKPIPYKAMVSLVKCGRFIYCLGGEDKPKSRTDACFRIPLADLLRSH